MSTTTTTPFLRQVSSRQSTAAQQIAERRRDWGESTPSVVIDLIWNTVAVLCVVIVVMVYSKDENTHVPLRLWLIVHGILRIIHMLCVFVEFVRRRAANLVCYTSVVMYLETANKTLSFIWWIIGIYWILSGGKTLANDAPKLFWLTVVFLALDSFVLSCIIGIGVCCCLPILITILCNVSTLGEASEEVFERLTKYKFRKLGDAEKPSGETQESFGGIITECNTDTPTEKAVSAADAACSICLNEYVNGSELWELPCLHHFHCACADKWLRAKMTCPRCKKHILENDNNSSEEV